MTGVGDTASTVLMIDEDEIDACRTAAAAAAASGMTTAAKAYQTSCSSVGLLAVPSGVVSRPVTEFMDTEDEVQDDSNLKMAARTAATVTPTTTSCSSVGFSAHEGTMALGSSVATVTMIAKYGKERLELTDLPGTTTIGAIKEMLQQRTRILPKRQKLVGLQAAVSSAVAGGRPGALTDDLQLWQLKAPASKKSIRFCNSTKQGSIEAVVYSFILMGTAEEAIFQDPVFRDGLPDVIDDFDLDFNAGSDEWYQHVATCDNLKKFTQKTAIHIMNPPRPNKALLVLDLDHTLLHFSVRTLQQAGAAAANTAVASAAAENTNSVVDAMKRPFLDQFLTICYQHYDLVVWSQTSWRWLETKLIELGMLSPTCGYRFCFVLDKTSMFQITSTNRQNGKSRTHHVKPLQIIWDKLGKEYNWGPHNTVHVDDLKRNFALNVDSGLLCTPYKSSSSSKKKRNRDADRELQYMAQYLVQLATAGVDFTAVNFDKWRDVVAGKCSLVEDAAGKTAGNYSKK